MIEAYFWAFINFKQDDWVWLFFIAEIAYNNVKNASTSHTSFKLNYEYYPRVFYKEDLHLCSKSKTTEELSFKL